ncbi:MAG: helix-turn-helix transcriptional regulator [Anaerolineales bacterium]|nr:helix-turn-helix transcriptional regulator [Anaerolineales bacterium]
MPGAKQALYLNRSFDTHHYHSNLLRAGTFHCPADHPQFQDTGPIEGWLIVFPRTSVTIAQEGRFPFVADPNTIVYYNRGQPYRRGLVSAEGDICDWFAFDPALVVELVAQYDDSVYRRELTPFTVSHSPCQTALYLQQRLIVRQLRHPDHDPLAVEEAAVNLLAAAVALAYQRATGVSSRRKQETRRAHRQLARDAATYLAVHFRQPLTIGEIAAALATSPYHLCRVFKREIGRSLHQHLSNLRLRATLEPLADSAIDLTTIGLDFGFASHSHFSAAFRKAFGLTPSQFRVDASRRHCRQMSRILKA